MSQSGLQSLNATLLCEPALSERRRKTEVVFWPPYLLCASGNPSRYPVLFEIGHPPEARGEKRGCRKWPSNVVWKALCLSAVGWACNECKDRKERRDVTSDEVRAWVLSTRRLARDWPYSNEHVARFSALADEIDDAFLPMRMLVAPGPRNVREDHRLRSTLHFWALELIS